MSWVQALTDVLLVAGGILVGVVLEHERALWAAHRRPEWPRGGTLDFTGLSVAQTPEWAWPPSPTSGSWNPPTPTSTSSSGVDPGSPEAA